MSLSISILGLSQQREAAVAFPVIPAKAGIHLLSGRLKMWIPAFAGMKVRGDPRPQPLLFGPTIPPLARVVSLSVTRARCQGGEDARNIMPNEPGTRNWFGLRDEARPSPLVRPGASSRPSPRRGCRFWEKIDLPWIPVFPGMTRNYLAFLRKQESIFFPPTLDLAINAICRHLPEGEGRACPPKPWRRRSEGGVCYTRHMLQPAEGGHWEAIPKEGGPNSGSGI